MTKEEEEFCKFMGYTFAQWDELKQLKKTVLINGLDDMLRENARLRGKVSFYESRIRQMSKFEAIHQEHQQE